MSIRKVLIVVILTLSYTVTFELYGAKLTTSEAKVFNSPEFGSMPYRLFVPEGYDPEGPALPLILFLHGAGERGTDNLSHVSKNINNLIQETQFGKHKAILLAPQVAKEKQWVDIPWSTGSYHQDKLPEASVSMKMAMKILTEVTAAYRVDKTRIYVAGISMGGYGAWDAITRYPDVFAAAMPLSGGGNLDAAPLLVNKGIWAYHGAADRTVPVSGSDDMIAAIKNAGGKPVYSRSSDKGHFGWDEFFMANHWRTDGRVLAEGGKGQDLYDWLFSFQLNQSQSATIEKSR